jgi:ParB-like chromosome segregation protein Spo0J
MEGTQDQPINRIQWVHWSKLSPNDYNPNQVFKPERLLLRLSILEDGWTQPIVATKAGEIVDGFHRWALISTDMEIAKLTDGKCPVVYLEKERGERVLSTIRHNRARGAHGVLKMAEIVRELIDVHNLDRAEVQRRLGMEDEEVERLYDQSGMVERGSSDHFGQAWVPDGGEVR